MSLNKICIHGRMTKFPELRKTNSGKSVCSFTLAVDRDSASDVTDFIPCVAFEKRAEFIAGHFSRGQEALVFGSLNIREYTDKNGVTRTVPEVMVAQVDFCGKRETEVRRPTEEEKQTFHEIVDTEGDLPF